MIDFHLSFYKNKRVFITGATGFIGTWLCELLAGHGARVTGYALAPAEESLFNVCKTGGCIHSIIGDVRDFDYLYDAFRADKPEIVFHLAAQPLTREGYVNPAYTYETNVLGTINILECIRMTECVSSFLNVTTDSVRHFGEPAAAVYGEYDMTEGYDPYTVSKSCAELVTHSYVKSFFRRSACVISTARSCYSIGGGDFSNERIVPDFFRAVRKGRPLIVRDSHAIQPYLHVLDTLNAYLAIAEGQYEDRNIAGSYSISPDARNMITAGALADLLCANWGDGAAWNGKHDWLHDESGPVKPDSLKISQTLNWKPIWNISDSVERTVEWYKTYINGGDAGAVVRRQIGEFDNRVKWPLVNAY